jgi:hypothetical protein
MKRLLLLAACVLVSLLMISAVNAGPKQDPVVKAVPSHDPAVNAGPNHDPAVNAGPNDDPVIQQEENQVQVLEQDGQSGPITAPNSRMSWREKVEMQTRINQRARAMRNAQLLNAQMRNEEAP